MEVENLNLPRGVQVTKSRNIGTSVRFDFTISSENLSDISRDLEAVIHEKWKLFINDHSRDDSDGGLIIERVNGRLRLMRGGHGYSSDWTPADIETVVGQIYLALQATKSGEPGGHLLVSQGA